MLALSGTTPEWSGGHVHSPNEGVGGCSRVEH